MVMFKRALDGMCVKNGFVSFITTSSWMYISSFEKLRNYILKNYSFDSIVDFGTELFDGKVGHNPIVAWVNRKANLKKDITGVRLVDFCYSRRNEKEPQFFNMMNYYYASKDNFFKIPGTPIAYWVNEALLDIYKNPLLSEFVDCKSGIMTGSDDFIKIWFEVSLDKINFSCKTASDMGSYKWFPLNSGGEFRKWFGNNSKIVNLYNSGEEIKNKVKNYRLRDSDYYFKKGITWGRITSSNIAFREVIDGSLFGDAGPIAFVINRRKYILGFLSSHVVKALLKITNPTMNFQINDIMNLPLIISDLEFVIEKIVTQNIEISKVDWDSFETSWDFERHPLLYGNNVRAAFENWEKVCDERFSQLKTNEEELNRIFIEIYGLQDELTPEVEEKGVTVRKANLLRDIKSFISYAVGCMFGRYSMDVPGLAYAGGEWDDNKYSSFIPDADNCIPITDEEYFEDDIIGRFEEFVKVVYGEETLEENLDFIAQALGNKGSTSREIIRNYFIKDFYKDHVKMYQKRPIYWLYDSGKQNGFKALVYMHRYTADTTGIVRVDYLHKMQKIYISEIDRMTDMVENSNNSREVAQAEKRKEKLIKQLKETKEYDEKVAHLALSRIAIDLDDGVKENHEKVQTGQDGKKLTILGKI